MSDRVDLAYRYKELRQFDLAEREVRAELAENPNDAAANALLGIILVETDREDEAKEQVRRAVAENPTLPYAHRCMAIVYRMVGELEAATRAAKEALRLDPKSPYSFHQLAACHYWSGRYEETIEVTDRALAIAVNHDYCLRLRAWALHDLGRLAEARIACDAALAADPNEATSFNLLALLREEEGDCADARAAIRESLRLDPNSEYAQKRYVKLSTKLLAQLCEQGELDQAAAVSEELKKLSPDESWSHHANALLDLQQGNVLDALKNLRRSRDAKGFKVCWLDWFATAFVYTIGPLTALVVLLRRTFGDRMKHVVGGSLVAAPIIVAMAFFRIAWQSQFSLKLIAFALIALAICAFLCVVATLFIGTLPTTFANATSSNEVSSQPRSD